MINDKIKKQALELSHQEHAELAHVLIDNLHPEGDLIQRKPGLKN